MDPKRLLRTQVADERDKGRPRLLHPGHSSIRCDGQSLKVLVALAAIVFMCFSQRRPEETVTPRYGYESTFVSRLGPRKYEGTALLRWRPIHRNVASARIKLHFPGVRAV